MSELVFLTMVYLCDLLEDILQIFSLKKCFYFELVSLSDFLKNVIKSCESVPCKLVVVHVYIIHIAY